MYKDNLAGDAQVFMAPGFDGAGHPDPTRRQTHGFNVDQHDRLYIAGVTTGLLHVYQLPAGNKIAEFNTGPGGYINDVAISPSTGDVYFTDSMRPVIWRVTEQQVESGSGTPQAIPVAPEVDYGPSTRTNNKLEVNGIRFTPGGKYVIFDDTNNGQLYRMTPPPAGQPAARQIVPITGVTPAQVGNADGLEFLNANTLYEVDNSSTPDMTPTSFDESTERIVKLRLSDDYRTATVASVTTNPRFFTPTAAALAPGNRLLVNVAKFFRGPPGPPYYVLSIPRP